MFEKFTPFIAIVIAIFIVGCGSSGNNTSVPPVVPIPVPPLQPLLTTKSLPANTAGTIVTENVIVSIPSTVLATTSTIVVTTAQTTEKPPKTNISLVGDRPMLSITSTSVPQDQVIVTISNLTRSRFDVGKTYYGMVQKTAKGWVSVTNFVEATGDRVNLAIDKTAFAVASGVNAVKGAIAKITIIAPVESKGLVEMQDDPSGYYKTRVLVMVPGFNDNVGDLAVAAKRFVELHQYRKIYGFSYDWRNETCIPAKALAATLDTLASQGYQIDLLAHSRGGLICRYVLENYAKTRNVLNFYAICTPHEGVGLANMGELMYFFRNQYLNSTNDTDQPFGILAFDTAAANELFPASDYFKSLNNPNKIIFAGHTNYHIVGAKEFGLTGGDYLAGGDTGQAASVQLESMTAGSINRYYLPNNTHGSLLKTADGLDQLCYTIFNRDASPLIVSVLPSDKYLGIGDQLWSWDVELYNNNRNSIQITDMSIEMYDMNGSQTSVSWYSPLVQWPDHFPQVFTSWGALMSSQEKIYLSFVNNVDDAGVPYDQLVYADKGATEVVVVRYQDTATKDYCTSRAVFRLLGPAGYPTEPKWRSVVRRTTKNVHSLLPRK